MKCPSELELNEYAEDRLPTERRWQVESHLRDCAGCRTDLQGLAWATEALEALGDTELDEAKHPPLEHLAWLKEGKLPGYYRADLVVHMTHCPECAYIYGHLPRERRARSLLRAWQPLAAAASLLIIVGLVFFVARGPFAPGKAMAPAMERTAAGPPAPLAPAPGAGAGGAVPPSGMAAPSGPGQATVAGEPNEPPGPVKRLATANGPPANASKPEKSASTVTAPAPVAIHPAIAPRPAPLPTPAPAPPPSEGAMMARGPTGPAGPRGTASGPMMRTMAMTPSPGGIVTADAAKGGGGAGGTGAFRMAEAAAPNPVLPADALTIQIKQAPVTSAPTMPAPAPPVAGMPGAPAPAPTTAAAARGAGGMAAMAVPAGPPAVAVPLALANRLLRDRRWLEQVRNDPARKAQIKARLQQMLKREKSGARRDVVRRALALLAR